MGCLVKYQYTNSYHASLYKILLPHPCFEADLFYFSFYFCITPVIFLTK
nr:MAG TPA: hypothetical protein [Caudoviricetes sp.]